MTNAGNGIDRRAAPCRLCRGTETKSDVIRFVLLGSAAEVESLAVFDGRFGRPDYWESGDHTEKVDFEGVPVDSLRCWSFEGDRPAAMKSAAKGQFRYPGPVQGFIPLRPR
jgi:hypothetical protein